MSETVERLKCGECEPAFDERIFGYHGPVRAASGRCRVDGKWVNDIDECGFDLAKMKAVVEARLARGEQP